MMDVKEKPDFLRRMKCFVFEAIKSNMYVWIENKEALIIDPNISERALQYLKNNEVEHLTIILTHEHHDHTSGVEWLRQLFESKLICQKRCAEIVALEKNNRPLLVTLVLSEEDRKNGTTRAMEYNRSFKPYVCKADITFENDMAYEWNGHRLEFYATPGHSEGSSCIMID